MSIIQTLIGSIVSSTSGGGGGNTYNAWTVEWFNKGISPQLAGAPRIFAVNSYPSESIGFSSEGFDYAWVGGAPGISTGVSSVYGGWQHWVIVSDGVNLGIFRDGQRLVYQPRERMVTDSGASLYVGISSDASTGYRGLITNFRIVKGQAMYDPNQGSIVVPALPLASNSNTQLLLKAFDIGSVTQDNSPYGRTPWGSGGLTWNSDTPFTAVAPITQTTNIGGSGIIDFTGSYYNADILNNVKAGWEVTDGVNTGNVTSAPYEASPGYIRVPINFTAGGITTYTFTQPALGGSIEMFENGVNYGYIGYNGGLEWALDVV